MDDRDWVGQKFEENRSHLRAVAYRMLGSLAEADDAVQESWLRLNRSDANTIENLGGWLTTVIGRVCLDMLRARKSRREEFLDAQIPDPILTGDDASDPEREAVLADSVGFALLVVLETLSPHERLAFVLHDMFDVPFDEIASIVGCSAVAARQLASRARRRLQGPATPPDADRKRQREVVGAFMAAVRGGDLSALLAVLDPDVVLREDRGPGELQVVRGARAIANRARMFSQFNGTIQPVLVNGAAGLFARTTDGQPFSVLAFAVRDGKIVGLDALVDPPRLKRLDLRSVTE